MLVATVLRPEEREDGELEVVRIAREERADSLVLPVREAECAMERRFRHAAQKLILDELSGHPIPRSHVLERCMNDLAVELAGAGPIHRRLLDSLLSRW